MMPSHFFPVEALSIVGKRMPIFGDEKSIRWVMLSPVVSDTLITLFDSIHVFFERESIQGYFRDQWVNNAYILIKGLFG
jgi:hypothetical protein